MEERDKDIKVVLITGASTGIGKSIAKLFAFNKMKVVINYLNSTDQAYSLHNEIENGGGTSIVVRADVTNEREVNDLISETIKKFGFISTLVNNAGGLLKRSLIEKMDINLWNDVICLNLTAAFLCSKATIPYMKSDGYSSIINISSSSAFTGGAGESVHYAAAKAGLIAFTKGLAKELSPRMIRVNAIAPGPILTPFHNKVAHVESMDQWVNKIPLRKIGSSDDSAKATFFLASDNSLFITGQTFHVNGGMIMY